MKYLMVLLCLIGLGSCRAVSSVAEDVNEYLRLDEIGVKNLSEPEEGVWAAGQLTEQQFDEITEQGLARLVNLRPAEENGTGWEESKADEVGVTFDRIPVSGKVDLTRANAERLAQLLDDAGDDPILVYCGSSNRVGALFALKAFYVDDASPEDALAIGKNAGLTKLEGEVRRQVGLQPLEPATEK